MSAGAALVGLVALLWLIVIVARPSRPWGMDEDQWLVYARMQGVWERLRLLALVATMALVFVLVLRLPSAWFPANEPNRCSEHQAVIQSC